MATKDTNSQKSLIASLVFIVATIADTYLLMIVEINSIVEWMIFPMLGLIAGGIALSFYFSKQNPVWKPYGFSLVGYALIFLHIFMFYILAMRTGG